jgi:hypothetical protein
MRRGIATILGAVVIAMSLVASTAAAFEPTSTEAEGPALADAQARLDAFTPPPDSQRVGSLPAGVATPQVGKLDPGPNLLEVTGYWMSTESVDAVRAYLDGYRPPETTLMLNMGSSGPGSSSTSGAAICRTSRRPVTSRSPSPQPRKAGPRSPPTPRPTGSNRGSPLPTYQQPPVSSK